MSMIATPRPPCPECVALIAEKERRLDERIDFLDRIVKERFEAEERSVKLAAAAAAARLNREVLVVSVVAIVVSLATSLLLHVIK